MPDVDRTHLVIILDQVAWAPHFHLYTDVKHTCSLRRWVSFLGQYINYWCNVALNFMTLQRGNLLRCMHQATSLLLFPLSNVKPSGHIAGWKLKAELLLLLSTVVGHRKLKPMIDAWNICEYSSGRRGIWHEAQAAILHFLRAGIEMEIETSWNSCSSCVGLGGEGFTVVTVVIPARFLAQCKI